jgi:hypothetical protein
VAASVVWLTTGAVVAGGALRTSALSCTLSASAGNALAGLTAISGSGFLIGTGAFDVTTTSSTMVKDKVF